MPKQTVAKDVPLAELTLRKYSKPIDMPRRELIRRLCLSLGLLQTGDSRDIVVDILHVLLDAKPTKELLDAEQVREKAISLRKQAGLPLQGVASSNVRRQLKRLRDLFLAEKIVNQYRIAEFESLPFLFEEKIKKYYLPSILTRIEEYVKALEP